MAEEQPSSSFKMKETPNSLRLFFLVTGFLGLLPLPVLPFLFIFMPWVGLVNLLGVCLSAYVFYCGIRIQKTLAKPEMIIKVLYVQLALIVLAALLTLSNKSIPFANIIAILIDIYLIRSVQRLSAEAKKIVPTTAEKK